MVISGWMNVLCFKRIISLKIFNAQFNLIIIIISYVTRYYFLNFVNDIVRTQKSSTFEIQKIIINKKNHFV